MYRGGSSNETLHTLIRGGRRHCIAGVSHLMSVSRVVSVWSVSFDEYCGSGREEALYCNALPVVHAFQALQCSHCNAAIGSTWPAQLQSRRMKENPMAALSVARATRYQLFGSFCDRVPPQIPKK